MTFRVAPQAECRQLLAGLNLHAPLSRAEEQKILRVIETYSGVPDGKARFVEGMLRNTLRAIIDRI